MDTSTPTVPTTMDHPAPAPVARCHTSAPRIGTSRPPTRIPYAMVSAVTTLGTSIAMTVTTTPSPSTYQRSRAIAASDSPVTSRDSCSVSGCDVAPFAADPPPSRERSNGTTSTRATVAEAISAPEAVDIIAATPAASTSPPSPTGRYPSARAAKASSPEARSGSSTAPAIPITAPATPYSSTYTPEAAPPQRATCGERAVNTRCQMSWPTRMPRV